MDSALEEELAARIEADADDPEAWGEEMVAPPRPRRTLGAQITVRLEPQLAERLREVADEEGVGYTQLVRRFIEERLREPRPASDVASEQVATFTVEVRVRPGA